jgi:hypothetical protein
LGEPPALSDACSTLIRTKRCTELALEPCTHQKGSTENALPRSSRVNVGSEPRCSIEVSAYGCNGSCEAENFVEDKVVGHDVWAIEEPYGASLVESIGEAPMRTTAKVVCAEAGVAASAIPLAIVVRAEMRRMPFVDARPSEEFPLAVKALNVDLETHIAEGSPAVSKPSRRMRT